MNTPILISEELAAKALQEAAARGLTLPEFVQIALERAVAGRPESDPLFTDTAVHADDGPSDLASHHDQYLYGDGS